MSLAYLVYWPWDVVRWEFEQVKILAHDSSKKFEHQHIQPGDRLFYTSCLVDHDGEFTGRLYLFGYMEVGKLISGNEEAQKCLANTFGLTYEVRQDVGNHVFAVPGTEEPYDLVEIGQLAGLLRFESPGGKDRLTVDSGLVMKPQELQALRQLTGSSTQMLGDIWVMRNGSRQPVTPESMLLPPPVEPDELTFPEGALTARTHLARERNRTLIARAKQRFKQMHDGRLFCQVCDFDFVARYGALGADYIEAHHTIPVSELEPGASTRIEDIAMVCANCHRMLHRRRPWLNMDELKLLVKR